MDLSVKGRFCGFIITGSVPDTGITLKKIHQNRAFDGIILPVCEKLCAILALKASLKPVIIMAGHETLGRVFGKPRPYAKSPHYFILI